MPLVSLLAIAWIRLGAGDSKKIADFSWRVFWFVIPSPSLFVTLPLLLKRNVSLPPALLVSSVVCILCYYLMACFLEKNGINL